MNHTWRKKVVAVTGVIGSGKSTTTEILRELGAFTEDADLLAREVVRPGSKAFKLIVSQFGRDAVLNKNGGLDRKKLASLVFSRPEQRKTLEDITHPIIAELSRERFLTAFKQDYPLYIYDCPLLFEAGLNKPETSGTSPFRKLVVVSANREICIKRTISRTGLARKEVEARLASQFPLEKKIAQADFVIDNSSSLEALHTQVEKLYQKLVD